MSELVKIEGRQVEKIEYKGAPVVTMAMVDDLHERPAGTAKRTFNKFLDRFIDGEDYFRVSQDEMPSTKVRTTYSGRGYCGDLVFFTESGYYLLTKPMKDDLSWRVYRILLNDYFRMRNQPQPQPQITANHGQANFESTTIKTATECIKKIDLINSVLELPTVSPDVIKGLRSILGEIRNKLNRLQLGADVNLY